MKHAVLAVLLLTAACGGSDEPEPEGPAVVHAPCGPLVITPSSDLSAMQRDAVENGLKLWNALGFTQLATSGEGAPVTLHFAKAAPFFHGYYDPKSGEVYVNTSMTDPAEIAVVVAHELGHAMGLPHVEPSERTSVMNPGNLTVTPTSADNALLSGSCH